MKTNIWYKNNIDFYCEIIYFCANKISWFPENEKLGINLNNIY